MKEQKVATKEIIRIEKMHRFIGPRRERVRNLKSLKQAFAVVLPERRYKPENIRPVRRMSFSSAGSLPDSLAIGVHDLKRREPLETLLANQLLYGECI